jgi:hypothetical protein
MKKSLFLILATVFLFTFSSCNSNDDGGPQSIQIPGITFDGDVDCCSAEETLQIYNFLQTVNVVPELTAEIDGKYRIYVYTTTGTLHVGYNDLYFVATKLVNGNYIKEFSVDNIKPVMDMTMMQMKHSTPVSSIVKSFNSNFTAVKHGWISLVMPTSESGYWTLAYDANVLGQKGGISSTEIIVNGLPAGQEWLKSFKVDDKTYYLSLVNPNDYVTGSNEIQAYVSQKSLSATDPYDLATDEFVIEIDPRMPDMDNHTSPDNTVLRRHTDGSYRGTINLTMTGLWRIHLTVRDLEGNVVAGGDKLKDGFSSLYWDVTL